MFSNTRQSQLPKTIHIYEDGTNVKLIVERVAIISASREQATFISKGRTCVARAVIAFTSMARAAIIRTARAITLARERATIIAFSLPHKLGFLIVHVFVRLLLRYYTLEK